MDGEVRRQKILKEIQGSESPVSGTQLARNFEVSRQVIVQDIAVLRAAGNEIVSTCRGYICQGSHRASRVIRVKHTDDEIMEELNTIVDFGGTAEDVFISHNVYGTLRAGQHPDKKTGDGFCRRHQSRAVQSAEKYYKWKSFSHHQRRKRRNPRCHRRRTEKETFPG